MMDSDLDQVTRSLFEQLRRDRAEVEDETSADFELLICPKCSDRLEPLVMPVEVNPLTKQRSQVIWWTCRGLNTKTCNFPLNMPADVFWTRRTAAQMHSGLLPLPDIDRLPAHFHYLYPSYFKRDGRPAAESLSRISARADSPTAVASLSNEMLRSTVVNNNNVGQSPLKRRRPDATKDRPKASAAPAADSIRYGNAASRRNVEIFADTNTALNSMIALKYQTDAFLSTINSEMSRKQLVRPSPAISAQQRRRLSTLMKRHRTKNHGVKPPSAVMTAMHRKAADNSRPDSPTSSLRGILSLAKVSVKQAKTLLPAAVVELFSPADDGGADAVMEEPLKAVTPPPIDPVNGKSTADNQHAASEAPVQDTVSVPTSADNFRSSTSTVLTAKATCSSPLPFTKTTISSTTSVGDVSTSSAADQRSQSLRLKSATKRQSLAPICAFDDPEIQSVMKRSFEELRRTMFAKTRKRKRQQKDADGDASALVAPPPGHGHVTPLKRVRAEVLSTPLTAAAADVDRHLPAVIEEEPALEDDFAALHDFSHSGRAFELAAAAACGHSSVFQTDFTNGLDDLNDEGDLALRRALLTHFNDHDGHDANLLMGHVGGSTDETKLFGLEHF